MNPFRDMDLYKAIVLVSLVLFPVGGYLIKRQNDDIAACRRTISEATKPGGLLEQIGQLQDKVKIVVQNTRSMSESIKNPSTYFEDQILAAAGGSTLKQNDFQPIAPKEEKSILPSKQPISDHVVEVAWPRKDMTVPMAFVYAVLFNCESGARASSDQVQQSVWKLRELTLVNATDERQIGSNNTPPAELADKWTIKAMKFARREPRKS